MKTYQYLIALLITASCDMVGSDRDERKSISLEELLGVNPQEGKVGTESGWKIGLLESEGFDLTQNYTGVYLEFSDLGKISASINDREIQGRWQIERGAGREELELNFPENTILEELDEDWQIVSRSNEKIVLEERDEEYVNRLTLVASDSQSINSSYQTNLEEAARFFQVLNNSGFSIERITSETRDRTSVFENTLLAFLPMGRLELRLSDQKMIVGSWLVGHNNQDITVLLNFEDDGLGDFLDEDWLMTSFNTDQIVLKEDEFNNADELVLLRE